MQAIQKREGKTKIPPTPISLSGDDHFWYFGEILSGYPLRQQHVCVQFYIHKILYLFVT